MENRIDRMLLLGLDAFCAFVALAFFLQRYRYRRRRRKGKSNWGFYPSSTAMGNAFQQLSVMAQPQVEYVLEEKEKEDVEEDDSGGPDDPTAHLHRQAARIRRGEKLERLTARYRP